MRKTPILAAVVAALAASTAYAQTNETDIGVLTCRLTGVTNVIVYTNERFDCVFEPRAGEPYRYEGRIRSVGVDLSVTQDMTLVWAVITTRTDGDVGNQLRGDYVGAGAGVAVGGGVGLNALVGGSERAITLQPVSVSGSVGVGASIGIESFELR